VVFAKVSHEKNNMFIITHKFCNGFGVSYLYMYFIYPGPGAGTNTGTGTFYK
jgi:hypothetical protein